jgi:antitoxin (DNA-binding transcriptional repressor) of toxin-antitoxin stability system
MPVKWRRSIPPRSLQAVLQQIGNPAALQALVAHGSPQGLTALQAGPAIAGLGLDQLDALFATIRTAAPDLTSMIEALIRSGNALPDALTQATEAITEAGVLAVQKAKALAFEQIQAAPAAGQNVAEAQQLGAAEVAQAAAQATGTQVPLGPLPDWVGQLEEAVTAPLQLAIQKEQAAGIQRVQSGGGIPDTTSGETIAKLTAIVRHDPHEWMNAIDHMAKPGEADPEAMGRRLPLRDHETHYPLILGSFEAHAFALDTLSKAGATNTAETRSRVVALEGERAAQA